MRALLINDEIRAEVAALRKEARKNPVPLQWVLENSVDESKGRKHEFTLADRKPDFMRQCSLKMNIPNGYTVAYSYEEQPMGLCHHMSVSVDTPGRLPAFQAVQEIAALFGITISEETKSKLTMWLEEFQPGHEAVNVVSLVEKEAMN